jgi:ketosteroid isomerase-like protein
MKYSFIVFLMCWSAALQAQKAHLIEAFSNLIDRTWVATGTWTDGSAFKQEITFNLELEKQLVTTKSDGFIDDQQTRWGRRNHGIRQWNDDEKTIKFWEFDVFGGVTSGIVKAINQNIYYHYSYGEGDEKMTLTDAWEYMDENTYQFKVGILENGIWLSIFLETKFVALPKYTGARIDLDAILAQTKQFSDTYKLGDHMAVSMFYTPDGKIMPGGSSIIQGRADIAEHWKLSKGVTIQNHVVHPTEIHIQEDIAYDYGYYQGESQTANGDIHPFKGKYVIVWKKLNGIWLIDIDIWNHVND